MVELNPAQGDGRSEYNIYLRWYISWASLYLLQPSMQPPTTYHPVAPEQRLLRDYIIRSKVITYHFAGGHGENASSIQFALYEINTLSSTLLEQLHIDYDAYDAHPHHQEPSCSMRDHQEPRRSMLCLPRRSKQQTYKGVSGSGTKRSNTDGRRLPHILRVLIMQFHIHLRKRGHPMCGIHHQMLSLLQYYMRVLPPSHYTHKRKRKKKKIACSCCLRGLDDALIDLVVTLMPFDAIGVDEV